MDVPYDCEGPDDLLGWRDVGADDFGNEVGGHADNADHRNQRETANEDEGLGQRCGAVVWNRHFDDGS